MVLAWATRMEPTRKEGIPFWCGEWIDLHSGDSFAGVVSYLRGLLDRAAPSLPELELVQEAREMCEWEAARGGRQGGCRRQGTGGRGWHRQDGRRRFK